MSDEGYGGTIRVPEKRDVYAPDGSEIRLLLNTRTGSSCHCTLPVHGTSFAGVHQSVEEIWYCLQGQGQIWRQGNDQEAEVALSPDVCVTIPCGTRFQFRNTGSEPLMVMITTMPPWPGEQEWIRVEDHWPVDA